MITYPSNISNENTEKNAQRFRLRRFGLSVATYPVAILATFLVTLLGLGTLSTEQWVMLIGLYLFGTSFFYIMFYTQTNLRFKEPSLTREQIGFSAFFGAVIMYWLPEARPIILLFFLPPFSFGMLSLTYRQYLVVVAWVLGVYATLIGIEISQDLPGYNITYQLYLFVLFSILLMWFASFGGFVSKLKRRAKVQKKETQEALELIKIEVEERKLAEEALIKEQSLLKTTLESTADGILVVATDGTWSTFNQKFLDMWGIPPSISEARDDQTALEHVVGSLANPEEFIAKVQELYKNFESESFDTFELKDGRFFARSSMPQWLDKQVIGRVWSFRDISERKTAEEKVNQQSIQRQKLLEMGRQITSSLDIDKVLNYISEQVRILLGSSGVTIYMLDSQAKELIPVLTYPPDYSEQILSAKLDVDTSLSGQVIKAGRGMIFNYADQQPDGHHIPGTPIEEDHLIIAPFIINEKSIGSLNIYRSSATFNEDDLALAETFTMYASTAINNARAHQELLDQIAERKQAEEALRESEEKYRLIVENANDGIEISQDDKILFSNARFAEMLGYTTPEILNKEFSRFFTEQAIQSLLEREKKRKHSIPVSSNYETTFRKKDGTIIYVDVKYEITEYKEKPATFAIIRDITERKQAEKALAESDSLRELLLDIITHDLKNPAGVIYALSEMARKDIPENQFLEAIYTGSGRLIEVLNQTTILNQAAFGETIPKETLSLNTLIKETVDEFVSALSTAEMELVVAIAPDLIIEANPLIGEVFKNYISNAIKYARDGKRIVIESVIEDQAVIVSVKDFGKTIAAADRDRIFERRAQLENGKERGRGLGLAIVKRIALAHDGEVWVEPNTPVGNSFCLRLPR